MSKTLDEAVAELERDPEHVVTAEVSGMIVELRCRGVAPLRTSLGRPVLGRASRRKR